MTENTKLVEEKAADLVYSYDNIDFLCDKKYISDLCDKIIDNGHIHDIEDHFAEITKALENKNLVEAHQILEKLFESWAYGQDFDVRDIKPIIKETLHKIEQDIKNKNFIRGLSSGFDNLDSLIYGFQPGHFNYFSFSSIFW